jgi:hypothetical protein
VLTVTGVLAGLLAPAGAVELTVAGVLTTGESPDADFELEQPATSSGLAAARTQTIAR